MTTKSMKAVKVAKGTIFRSVAVSGGTIFKPFYCFSAIFRPKDPYRDRPLPYLIGSKDWQEKWHIGLVESDTEDASDIEPIDEMSESLSSSSPSMASLHSHVPASMSESEYSVWGNGATAAVAGPPHKNGSLNFFINSNFYFSFFYHFFMQSNKTFSMRVLKRTKAIITIIISIWQRTLIQDILDGAMNC